MAIALSIILCLLPILLTIHLAVKKNEALNYKKKLGYVYGGLWAIAFGSCVWLFFYS